MKQHFRSEKQATLERMAADLQKMNATGSERDAMRALLAKPYRMGDVVALVELALALAIATQTGAAS